MWAVLVYQWSQMWVVVLKRIDSDLANSPWTAAQLEVLHKQDAPPHSASCPSQSLVQFHLLHPNPAHTFIRAPPPSNNRSCGWWEKRNIMHGSILRQDNDGGNRWEGGGICALGWDGENEWRVFGGDCHRKKWAWRLQMMHGWGLVKACESYSSLVLGMSLSKALNPPSCTSHQQQNKWLSLGFSRGKPVYKSINMKEWPFRT